MKVTITDIANIAGVSIATVSRVINNKSKGVGEETRKRIWRIIEENNFQPSAVARGLVTKSSKIIGLIIPDITNPFYPILAKGVEEAASKRGYNTILCDGGNDPGKEAAYLKFLNEHYVSGIVYNNFRAISESTLEILSKSSLPTIFVDSKVTLAKANNLYIDNKVAMHKVIYYLYEQGHRKIAFLSGPSDSYSAIKRFKGYLTALEELGLEYNADLVVEGDFTIKDASKAVERLIERKVEFTAMACCNDLMALGAYEKFEEMGIKIPDDISIIGFDGIETTKLVRPRLTTVIQPNREMGRESANVLIDVIEGKRKKTGKDIMFETELKIRDSVKKIIV